MGGGGGEGEEGASIGPYTYIHQGCQVWSFRGQKNKFGLFLLVGLEIFENLLSSWLFKIL